MMSHVSRIFKAGTYKLRVGKSRTGRGVYAEEPIPKGSCVIEYVGRPATGAQQKANTGKYLFWTSDITMIDGNIAPNKARFINHSCRPNCEIDTKSKRIFVFAKKNIKVGDELNYDYGPEYFEMYFAGGRCRCPKCFSSIK
jgi:uncharacterized protein